MSILPASCLCAVLFAVSPLSAQRAGPGLGWYGTSGNTAVSYVSDCTPRTVASQRRETVTLRVWGDMNSPFVLFVAASASSCIPIPGLGGSLVADGPFATLAVGVLTQTTPCLSCPPGYEDLVFGVPGTVPIGTSLSVQAIALGAGRASFTVAITATVN